MDYRMELMDRIMGALFNSDEWNRILMSDPRICTATKRVSMLMDRLQSIVPYELYSELEDAIGHSETAHSDAGILFGIYVADTIRQTVANPAVYSDYWLKLGVTREATA